MNFIHSAHREEDLHSSALPRRGDLRPTKDYRALQIRPISPPASPVAPPAGPSTTSRRAARPAPRTAPARRRRPSTIPPAEAPEGSPTDPGLSLIHISEPTRRTPISYAV